MTNLVHRKMPPAGFEPATCSLGMSCSIQLSYEGVDTSLSRQEGSLKEGKNYFLDIADRIESATCLASNSEPAGVKCTSAFFCSSRAFSTTN